MDNRRKQYWIDKPFQKRIIVQLALLVIGCIGAAHFIALGYMKLVQSAPDSSADLQLTLATQVNTNLASGSFLNQLWLPALITCLLGILFVLGFGLLYSHRIAGPMFNLKRVLHKVGEGDLSVVMHIRTKDEFHDIEASFNQMVTGLQAKHETLRKALDELPDANKRKILQQYRELFTLTRIEN